MLSGVTAAEIARGMSGATSFGTEESEVQILSPQPLLKFGGLREQPPDPAGDLSALLNTFFDGVAN
jgi:hypothetical protein